MTAGHEQQVPRVVLILGSASCDELSNYAVDQFLILIHEVFNRYKPGVPAIIAWLWMLGHIPILTDSVAVQERLAIPAYWDTQHAARMEMVASDSARPHDEPLV